MKREEGKIMSLTIKKYSLVLLVLALLAEACTVSRIITRKSELMERAATGDIDVLMHDGTRYTLENYKLKDSLLIGRGISERDRVRSRFEGQLKLSDIDYIKTESIHLGKTLIATGAVVFVGVKALSYLGGSREPTINENVQTYIPGGGGGGSCPFVYSYDGADFKLESETFAGAVFKGAEHASHDVLSALKPVGGKYLLRLTNERTETEYVNLVKLSVVDIPPGMQMLPDQRGMMHTIASPLAPQTAVDLRGRDVRKEIASVDDLVWESELAGRDFSRDDDLRDGLVLEFPKPEGATVAKLVVRGINTPLGVFAFEQLITLMGDRKMEWYQKLEKDSVEANKMIRFMMREGMLHISIWENGTWVAKAPLMDVGPNVPKSQMTLIDLRGIHGGVLAVKLECVADLWKIDQVGIDYSPDRPVNIRELSPVTAINDENHDVTALLQDDDNRYYTTIKEQSAMLTFEAPPVNEAMTRMFVLKTKGYYHQWFEGSGEFQASTIEKILTQPMYGSKKYMPIWRALKESPPKRTD